jgi:CMP-N,N'-diacetyllegionaminic acid synthase
MKVLAIIPARGGSKGIKRKNLVEVKGHSLLSYSIRHAKESSLVTRVIVSTEDPEIKEEALRCGAEVVDRPAELAGDLVFDLPVFEHVLQYLNDKDNYQPDLVVHLRPTAPFREKGWIDECISLLQNNSKADSVRSVSEPDKHPYRIFRIDAAGFLDPIMKHEHPTPYLLRRQDLPPVYYYNCVIDVTRPVTIKNGSMTGEHILPWIMNPDDVIDIDSPRDLQILNALFADRL